MPFMAGRIPLGRRVGCECIDSECQTVSFERDALKLQTNTLAIAGRANQAVAATGARSLTFRKGRNSLRWEIEEIAAATEAGQAIQSLHQAGISVYGRPIIDASRAVGDRSGIHRNFSSIVMRALLLKPILGNREKRGWEPAVVNGESTVRYEKRFVEFRAETPDVLSGIVLRYGDVAKISDWSERFEARSVTIADDAIVNLMHNREKPVARIGAGLELRDDGAAITARVTLPDTVYGREARELVQARILRGMSIEFEAREERFEGRQRVIKSATMLGLGLVDRPAYPDSVIAQRFAVTAEPEIIRPPRRRII